MHKLLPMVLQWCASFVPQLLVEHPGDKSLLCQSLSRSYATASIMPGETTWTITVPGLLLLLPMLQQGSASEATHQGPKTGREAVRIEQDQRESLVFQQKCCWKLMEIVGETLFLQMIKKEHSSIPKCLPTVLGSLWPHRCAWVDNKSLLVLLLSHGEFSGPSFQLEQAKDGKSYAWAPVLAPPRSTQNSVLILSEAGIKISWGIEKRALVLRCLRQWVTLFSSQS